MARPKQLVTRDKTVPVRLSALEKEALELMASKTGLSVSEYLRRSAFNQSVSLRFSEEELALYKQLHEFRTHFLRISNLVKLHQGGAVLLQAIDRLREKMEAHLQKFEA